MQLWVLGQGDGAFTGHPRGEEAVPGGAAAGRRALHAGTSVSPSGAGMFSGGGSAGCEPRLPFFVLTDQPPAPHSTWSCALSLGPGRVLGQWPARNPPWSLAAGFIWGETCPTHCSRPSEESPCPQPADGLSPLTRCLCHLVARSPLRPPLRPCHACPFTSFLAGHGMPPSIHDDDVTSSVRGH